MIILKPYLVSQGWDKVEFNEEFEFVVNLTLKVIIDQHFLDLVFF